MRASATISLSALKHNFQCVKQLVPNAKILAMIKCNAYGHGAVQIAQSFEQADAFGVADINEALALREAGLPHPIVLMSGFFAAEELPIIASKNLDIVVHHESQLDIMERHALSDQINVWLKVDSGMHRLGFLPDQLADAVQRLQRIVWVNQPLRLMTHLAEADNFQSEVTKQQLDTFATAVKAYSGERCIANSAAIIAWPEAQTDWVRPGIMLYGVSPLVDHLGEQHGLKPAMTLSAKLTAIHSYPAGAAIGYGSTWRCPETMSVGVVSIGYGDGYPRHAVDGTPVLINGIECGLVGRVSMDMITVDLRPVPDAKIDDEVILWGEGLPVERVARCANTIGYELLTQVARRVNFTWQA